MAETSTIRDKNKYKKYKIRNWSEYNKSLCQRGSLQIWFEESLLKEWSDTSKQKKEVGGKFYSDAIIQVCLSLKVCYGLRLRQCTGFIRSLLDLTNNRHFRVPNYTTLCRRQSSLIMGIESRLEAGENLNVAIDSTGLKVFGEGEWKVRKHGNSKRRTWRKLHLCVDPDTHHILSAALTGNDEDDASVGMKMLEGKTDKIQSIYADGAYDKFAFRKVLADHIKQLIPPPKNAVIKQGKGTKPLPEHLIQRNQAVEYISKHGIESWKEHTGYNRRSLAETAMFRFKTIFGDKLNARKTANQNTEAKIKCMLLDKFTEIGMPESYKLVDF